MVPMPDSPAGSQAMSKQGGCSKAGGTKDKPSQKAYTLAMRWERNKARRIKREAAKQAKDATLRASRDALQKKGALTRIERRLAAATSDAERARLSAIRLKAAAAANAVARAA